MATQERSKYKLSGDAERTVALDDAQIEERMEESWWSPDIPRKELKALMQRSDGYALADFGFWIILLIASGYAVVVSWGTLWVVPALFVYGTIYSSSDARWHECGHGTPFKTRWLNEFFYQVSSFMTIREAVLWRWSHSRHHTHTIIVGRDPELPIQRPPNLFALVVGVFYFHGGYGEIRRIVRHAMGNPDSDVRTYVPEQELKKMYWSSRIYLAIVAGFVVWSIAIGSLLPIMMVWLPRFYGGWLHHILGLTQHAALAEDTFDHRENCRTVHINPIFSYLYLNMEYHVEHHTTPMIPYHALPKYHDAIKDQTPPAYPSLWAVYKEMVPALIKQATQDVDHYIKREVPTPFIKPVEQPLVKTAESIGDDWVEVCAVDELDQDDIISFDHNGKTYAVYRLANDEFYATDGICTHAKVALAGGLVIDGCIECPKHNGRFEVKTGAAVRHPAQEDLNTYPVEQRGDKILVFVSSQG
jgi:MocE subfamily Rieske [2Fe-2S] domain protein